MERQPNHPRFANQVAKLAAGTSIYFFLLTGYAENCIAQTSPTSTPQITAAVWDLENLSPSAISDETVQALSQQLRFISFKIMQDYSWLERGRINEILGEQKLQASGCTDQSCVVEIGQLLGARKMLSGTISKTGNVHKLTLNFIDIATGLLDNSASETCSNCNESQLDHITEAAVKRLTQKRHTSHKSNDKDLILHGGRVNLDIGYLSGGARLFLSPHWALEGKFQHAEEKNQNATGYGEHNLRIANLTGARIYYYPYAGTASMLPYLCVEGDHIKFQGKYAKGSGVLLGGFAGLEYFVSRNFSAQTDLGAAMISIRDDDYPVDESGLEFILNVGINVYFGG